MNQPKEKVNCSVTVSQIPTGPECCEKVSLRITSHKPLINVQMSMLAFGRLLSGPGRVEGAAIIDMEPEQLEQPEKQPPDQPEWLETLTVQEMVAIKRVLDEAMNTHPENLKKLMPNWPMRQAANRAYDKLCRIMSPPLQVVDSGPLVGPSVASRPAEPCED